MQDRHILILGGYGTTGLCLAQLLLENTEVCITLAGRSLEKAQNAAEKLGLKNPGKCVNAVRADAGDADSLCKVFKGMDLVVVASSTAKYAETVVRAAILAEIDYLDVQYSNSKLEVLKAHAREIENTGLCFITEGGFHPGLPAAMVRFAADNMEKLQTANIFSVFRIDWASLELSPATIQEFIGEFMNFESLYFKDGRWKQLSPLGMMFPRWKNFGNEFGFQYCIPMFLEEMHSLPDMIPTLFETGFFVGGFNWFVDWFLTPVIIPALKLSPEKSLDGLGKLMYWGLRTFSGPPYGTMLKLEARGKHKNLPYSMEMLISHRDGYALTAIPVAACLFQYLDGSIRKPGLWFQARVVETGRFFKDMERLGASFRIIEKDQ